MIRRYALVAALLFLGSALPSNLPGADYPAKPIEMLVPYTPGSSMDLDARLLAEISAFVERLPPTAASRRS